MKQNLVKKEEKLEWQPATRTCMWAIAALSQIFSNAYKLKDDDELLHRQWTWWDLNLCSPNMYFVSKKEEKRGLVYKNVGLQLRCSWSHLSAWRREVTMLSFVILSPNGPWHCCQTYIIVYIQVGLPFFQLFTGERNEAANRRWSRYYKKMSTGRKYRFRDLWCVCVFFFIGVP